MKHECGDKLFRFMYVKRKYVCLYYWNVLCWQHFYERLVNELKNYNMKLIYYNNNNNSEDIVVLATWVWAGDNNEDDVSYRRINSKTVLYSSGRGRTKATNYKVCLVQVKLVSVKLRQVLVLHLRRHTLIITVNSLAGSPEARAY